MGEALNNPQKRRRLPEFFWELKRLIEAGERPDTGRLAQRFNVSRRTIQRWAKELRAGAPSEGGSPYVCERRSGFDISGRVLPATPKDWRAVDYLNYLWHNGTTSRRELLEMARSRHTDVSERTSERDLAALVAAGLVEEVKLPGSPVCYRLGPLLASDPGLSDEEAERLLNHLKLRMRMAPDQNRLASAYAKVVQLLKLGLGGTPFAHLVAEIALRSRYCLIQGRLPEMDLRETLYLRAVETAIRERRKLRMVYRGGHMGQERGEAAPPDTGSTAGSVMVSPLGVIYYWVLDAWYLVSESGPGDAVSVPIGSGEFRERDGRGRTLRLWRLDRIRSLSLTEVPYTYPPGFDLHEAFADRWGLQGGEMTHVRVRFYNDFNVVERMKRETAHRRNRKLEELPDGSYIFEDDVVGLDDFRMWLRGFGASAEVLEPLSLRRSMYESALKLLERYREE